MLQSLQNRAFDCIDSLQMTLNATKLTLTEIIIKKIYNNLSYLLLHIRNWSIEFLHVLFLLCLDFHLPFIQGENEIQHKRKKNKEYEEEEEEKNALSRNGSKNDLPVYCITDVSFAVESTTLVMNSKH